MSVQVQTNINEKVIQDAWEVPPDEYAAFLESKRFSNPTAGFVVTNAELNPMLYDFQQDIVKRAIRRGRFAIFADCGLGKSPMQIEWSRLICLHTQGDVLIVAPLAVAEQTKREGQKFGVEITVCRTQSDVKPGINITNYEMLRHFDPRCFIAMVIDESSILKGFDGKTRKELTDFASVIPYRLACTATPAPNDLIELTNHAEFLGVMQGKEIVALFFTQDGNTTHKMRLKGHAKQDFWKWMATWCVALRSPADLGYDGSKFVLPKLHFHEVIVQVNNDGPVGDSLFALEASTLQERRQARRFSLADRVSTCAEIVSEKGGNWLIWCDLNDESKSLSSTIANAAEVTGSDSAEWKASAMMQFADGTLPILVSKPSICGFGMNWQNCHQMAFVGVSDSYEQMYQAIRREWRYGQTEEVHVYIIISELEGAVLKNLKRKEKDVSHMTDELVKHMQEVQVSSGREEMEYRTEDKCGMGWKMMLGDCVERIKEVASNSIGVSVFSPPFPGMYTYTNSPHDMGNTKDIEEMIAHFKFLMEDLLRVTMPGRSACIHLTQAVAFKGVDGYIGIKDFRGKVIEAMETAGWIYYGEVTIDKNPQLKAIRTKDRGLLFKTLATDSAHMHMALADYLLQFRKPGDNPFPIQAGISTKYKSAGWITQEEWIRWARPVWYSADFTPEDEDGIRETDVLNVAQARDTNDERHLCPLQIGVIERAIKLWSAPGETVFSPFAGIGSEGVTSLRNNRNFIGIELKPGYYTNACRNIGLAERVNHQQSLFDEEIDE